MRERIDIDERSIKEEEREWQRWEWELKDKSLYKN